MSSRPHSPTGMISKSSQSRAYCGGLRERMRFFVGKLLGYEQFLNKDVLAVFSDAASRQSPKFIAELLASTICKTFGPRNVVLVARGDEVSERVLLAFRSVTKPVILRQSPLKAQIPYEDVLLALPLGKAEETEYLILLGNLGVCCSWTFQNLPGSPGEHSQTFARNTGKSASGGERR